jgi:hypothetical protein
MTLEEFPHIEELFPEGPPVLAHVANAIKERRPNAELQVQHYTLFQDD